MPSIEYRMYFNNTPASRELLDRIEDITVEQEVDMAWEARIDIPIYVDDTGQWVEQDRNLMASFSRVRVEIKVDENPFVSLIDGPVVGHDTQMSSEPGQSSLVLLVHDDSVYLNRDERVSVFENMADHEIAEQLLSSVSQIVSTDIESTPSASTGLSPSVVQRGTTMQLLQQLARRQGMHAYVLPGENPGETVGCFKSFPVGHGDLPDFVLLGSQRNIETFDVQYNAQSPSTATTSVLSITDKGVITRSSSFRDLELLGEEPPSETEEEVASQLLSPTFGESVDPAQAVTAEVSRSSFAFEATGRTLGHRYAGVLQPYEIVTVRGVNEELNGEYVITQATHSLTRSSYIQSFTVRRNARSGGLGGFVRDLAGSIF